MRGPVVRFQTEFIATHLTYSTSEDDEQALYIWLQAKALYERCEFLPESYNVASITLQRTRKTKVDRRATAATLERMAQRANPLIGILTDPATGTPRVRVIGVRHWYGASCDWRDEREEYAAWRAEHGPELRTSDLVSWESSESTTEDEQDPCKVGANPGPNLRQVCTESAPPSPPTPAASPPAAATSRSTPPAAKGTAAKQTSSRQGVDLPSPSGTTSPSPAGPSVPAVPCRSPAVVDGAAHGNGRSGRDGQANGRHDGTPTTPGTVRPTSAQERLWREITGRWPPPRGAPAQAARDAALTALANDAGTALALARGVARAVDGGKHVESEWMVMAHRLTPDAYRVADDDVAWVKARLAPPAPAQRQGMGRVGDALAEQLGGRS